MHQTNRGSIEGIPTWSGLLFFRGGEGGEKKGEGGRKGGGGVRGEGGRSAARGGGGGGYGGLQTEGGGTESWRPPSLLIKRSKAFPSREAGALGVAVARVQRLKVPHRP